MFIKPLEEYWEYTCLNFSLIFPRKFIQVFSPPINNLVFESLLLKSGIINPAVKMADILFHVLGAT